MRTGTNLPARRACSASSLTHWLATEFMDHKTTMHRIFPSASAIADRHLVPARILRSHHTVQPDCSNSVATLRADSLSSSA